MKQEKDKSEIGLYKENYLLNSVFVKDTDLQFIFKKTEKIITAVYLVTNFMVVEEPLKWSLRKSASGLLKTLMSFSQSSLSDREKNSHNLNVDILELNSLFDLAFHSGFVSQMNYDILNFEISKLTANISEYNSESLSSNKGLFDNEYFYVQKMPNDNDFYAEKYKGQTGNTNQRYKGQNENTNSSLNKNVFYSDIKDKFTNNLNINQNSSQNQNTSGTSRIENETNVKNKSKGQTSKKGQKTSKGQNKKTNEDRREKIITEVKRQKLVSVKDIAKVVTDCSEKTLQRELLSMVDEGILNKEGERRWSKYSLK